MKLIESVHIFFRDRDHIDDGHKILARAQSINAIVTEKKEELLSPQKTKGERKALSLVVPPSGIVKAMLPSPPNKPNFVVLESIMNTN